MTLENDLSIVTVDGENFREEGFFCYKSKPTTLGYKQKLDWLEKRFTEGMKIKILYAGRRSFGFGEAKLDHRLTIIEAQELGGPPHISA